jgi:branched-chain amino acid transport system ATP-binding protein
VSAEVAIKTRHVTKRFSGFMAVNDVNFEVPEGQLRAIIGPNGAGKTTFFRLLSGELRVSSGQLWFEGRDVTDRPAFRLARLGVGRSYQITNGFPNLTVFENMRIAAQPPGLDFKFWSCYREPDALSETTNVILDLVGLGSKRNVLAGELSYGNRRRLELAMALGNDPRVLLLDEPTAGMTPKETDSVIELIRDIARGRTVILVEHKMKLVMSLCERISVFHQGRIVAEGSPEEIRANREVQSIYFGSRLC